MKITIRRYNFLMALYFLLCANFPFSKQFYQQVGGFHIHNAYEILLTYGTLFLIFFLIFTLTSFQYLTKFLGCLLILSSAFVSYTVLNYNTLFNDVIIRSFFETTFAEAYTYFTLDFVLYMLVIGVLPCVLIGFAKLEYPPVKKFLFEKILTTIVLVLVGAGVYLSNQLYFNAFVDNAANYELKKKIIPFNYLVATRNYISEILQVHRQTTASGKPAEKKHFQVSLNPILQTSKRKTIFVFVLGESARARSFSLNGYERDTDAYLEHQNVVSFSRFYSCGTATAVSLPCMFSNFGRKNFSYDKFDNTDDLLDIINQAQYKVTWFDNGMGSQHVADGVKEVEVGSYYVAPQDDVLLDKLPSKDQLAQENQNQFIVLHQRGSHGPDYSVRYTEPFRKFTPDCHSAILKSCARDDIVNAYDNTILYTDHNVNEVVEYLKTLDKDYNTLMLYVSDHGESTGEYGLYMHGMPYSIAPDDQTHIPFIVWFSNGFQKAQGLNLECVKKLKQEKYSHDNIFHTVLGLLDIKSDAYDQAQDMFRQCKI